MSTFTYTKYKNTRDNTSFYCASTNVSAFLQTERINTELCIRKERVANEMVAHNVAW